jgi:uncharacterized protein YggE
MDTLKSQKVWKIVGVIVVILLVVRICVGGGHDWRGDNRIVNTITVSGKGEVVVIPDIATVSFGVTAENADVSKAQTESATKINKIMEFLKAKGIEAKDIKNINYSIYPRYDYTKVTQAYPYGGKQVLAGYTVSQTVEVKIHKDLLPKVGEILSGVGEFGVTDVSGLTFSVDKIDAEKNKARDEAIKDARAQAKVLADELGVKLVKITSFSENGNYPMYYGMDSKVMAAAPMGMGGGVSPEIPTGENKITSSVVITYEIR